MVQHFSSNIQNTILRELFKAQSSIKIAVAWFTNDLLFQPLLLKLQTGVVVSIITNFDEINFSDSNNIDFDNFVSLGGELHLNRTKTLMHDKFCIIDDNTVIAGTYNWTNKAEHNDESIMLISEDENLASSYKTLFKDMLLKYPSTDISSPIKKEQYRSVKNSLIDDEPFCNMYRVNGFINIMEDYETPESAIIVAGQYVDDKREKYYESILDYKTLQPILPYEFTNACHMSTKNGTIWLKKNNRYGLFSIRLRKFLTLFSFTNITNWGNNYIVKLNGLYGVCNCNGEILIPCEYDEIDNRSGITQKNGRYGVINSNSVLLPAICDSIDLDGKASKVGDKYGLLSDSGFKDINGQRISRGMPALNFVYDEIKFHGYIDYEIGNFYVLRQGKEYGLYVPYKGFLIPCSEFNSRYERYDEDMIIHMLHHKLVRKYKK